MSLKLRAKMPFTFGETNEYTHKIVKVPQNVDLNEFIRLQRLKMAMETGVAQDNIEVKVI